MVAESYPGVARVIYYISISISISTSWKELCDREPASTFVEGSIVCVSRGGQGERAPRGRQAEVSRLIHMYKILLYTYIYVGHYRGEGPLHALQLTRTCFPLFSHRSSLAHSFDWIYRAGLTLNTCPIILRFFATLWNAFCPIVGAFSPIQCWGCCHEFWDTLFLCLLLL